MIYLPASVTRSDGTVSAATAQEGARLVDVLLNPLACSRGSCARVLREKDPLQE